MLKLETFISNQQFINAWLHCQRMSQRRNCRSDELVITWSGTDSVMLNAVFLTKPVYDEVELETRIKNVIMLSAISPGG